MRLNSIQRQTLIVQAVNGTIKTNDAKRLFKALRKRFNKNEIETFREKLILAAFLLFGFEPNEERNLYISDSLERYQRKISAI